MIESKAADVLARLLKVVGLEAACPKCGSQVLRVKDDQGRALVLNCDGTVHWNACSSPTRLATLLRMIGSRGLCQGCKKPVLWIKTKAGKNSIYDPDGVSHWATCPSADQHRKPKGETDAAASDQSDC